MRSQILPNNKEAEMGVLGSILFENDTMDKIMGLLCPEDFYHKNNQIIYSHMVGLRNQQNIIDLVALTESLEKKKQLQIAGGQAYLMDLMDATPTATVALPYAKMVKEKSVLRELILTTNKIQEDSYAESVDVTNLLDRAESMFRHIREDKVNLDREFVALADLIPQTYQSLEMNSQNPGLIDSQCVKTGFEFLDRMLGGLQRSDLIILAARPSMGKTALALNIARNATFNDIPAALFSIETNSRQIAQRMLLTEARVNSNDIRNGCIDGSAWVPLSNASGRLANAPFYIYDAPTLSINEMRVHTKNVVEKGARLLIIDYLQLIAASGMGGGRVQEVSEITRGIKSIAREFDIPILLLSQLSRKCEDRKPPIPILSDLRESGCLSVETTTLLTDNGVQSNKESRMLVYSLSNNGTIEMSDSKNIKRSRKRELYRTTLRSGRFIDSTKCHPILTDKGWVKAEHITSDHAIACVRKVPAPNTRKLRRIKEARWIGWMLGNGSMLECRSPSFICSDPKIAKSFIKQTEEFFKTTPKIHKHWCTKVFQYNITYGPKRTSIGNPCKDWLIQNDLWGRKSYEKIIPQWFFEQADDYSIAELIGGLVDTDGSVPIRKKDKRASIKYSTTSLEMARQILWLMARIGIFARMGEGELNSKANYPCYSLVIAEGLEIDRFRKIIKLTGIKQKKLTKANVSFKGSNYGDRLGEWVGGELVKFARENGISQQGLGYRDQSRRISQRDLARFLGRIGIPNNKLDWLVNPNIFWDRLKSFKYIGDGYVFDREVDDHHNFVANGIIVHNSIEQDADVVVFIYRSSYYTSKKEKKKSKRAPDYPGADGDGDNSRDNTADIIIGKQRNGPCGTGKMVFLKEFTQFADIDHHSQYEG